MRSARVLLIAAALSGVLGNGLSMAGGPERQTVSINDRVPSPQQVEEALFPKQIKALKEECAQMEKAGMRCQSVIPKSSLDSVLVTFGRGSASLTDEAVAFLSSVGTALQRTAATWTGLRIEGHADATGTRATNQRLSKQRADAVKSYLETNFGLKNIETVGRSSDDLKDPTDPGSAMNRRIELVPEW